MHKKAIYLDYRLLHSCLHFCFHFTVTFALYSWLHFGQGFFRRQQVLQAPGVLLFLHLLVVVLTVPLFSRICECLVPYFDSSSSDSRNCFFLWFMAASCQLTLNPLAGLGSLALPEFCILVITLSLFRVYLEPLCYAWLSSFVFSLWLVNQTF